MKPAPPSIPTSSWWNFLYFLDAHFTDYNQIRIDYLKCRQPWRRRNFCTLCAGEANQKVKWLIIPAIIGGSALLADGIITPPISVSSAVEGIRTFYPEINTVPIVIGILFALFYIQQFGTKLVGKFFAPMMLLWFGMLGVLSASFKSLTILRFLKPSILITAIIY